MKKLWFVALLAMLLTVLFCMAVGAETVNGTDGEIAWSFETESGELTVSGAGKMKNYTDPAKTPWKEYRDSICSLVVESGVTSVGRWAFADCASLKSVTLPEGLTAISYGAFENCVALTEVVLPSTLKSINYGAFQNCKSLTSIDLPQGLTTLEGKAFAGCSSLKEITLPKGVTELKWGVFENCTSLKEAPLHDGVKSIDAYAFKGCDNMESVSLPNSVKSVGGNAFERCASLIRFVISSIRTWISGGKTTIPDSTTIYAEPNSDGEKYADTYDKNVVIGCMHQDVTVTEVTPYTCYENGMNKITCNGCGHSYTVTTEASHKYDQNPSALGFVEYVCRGTCGYSAIMLPAGETLKLSAFCQGTLSFALEASSTDDVVEMVVDGENRGTVEFSAEGVGTVTIENLEEAGHTVEFINHSRHMIYVKNTEIDGAFHHKDTVYDEGAVYLEMLGKGNLEYSDFYAYVRTSDPSGDYYVCYNFDYIYNVVANSFAPNTCTNISLYRLNGATLVKVTGVSETEITSTPIYPVLGSGEVSMALRWTNPDWNRLPAELNNSTNIYSTADANNGTVIEHIGGFHGDEWQSAVSLVADGTVVDLKTSERKVIACSSLLFDLTSTLYTWGTSYQNETEYYRGDEFAEHIQNFVINADGINHMQTIEWLRDDFQTAGYMPMFTMMRGGLSDRFIDTMRSYDANGNLLGTYVMTAGVPITSQTNVLADWAGTSVAAYEYDGSKGVSARVEFREANDKVHLGSYIAMRSESNGNSSDNKMYAPLERAEGGMAEIGEVWMVESHYVIDYNTEKIK